MKNMVSIILAVYNGEKFLSQAIESVLKQDHQLFELIIVDDGSVDSTASIAKSYKDNRIIYTYQKNAGVSIARNTGLRMMKGHFFCFLDVDDQLTPFSLSARLRPLLEMPEYAFCGGTQVFMNEKMSQILEVRESDYNGWTERDLVLMDGRCFISCGNWLVRRYNHKYVFQENWTHCEDLAFFLSISHDGKLVCVPQWVYLYRRHQSAMSDLDGLWRGYKKYFSFVMDNHFYESIIDLIYLNLKIRKIMFLSFLSIRSYSKAFRTFLETLRD